MNTHPDDGFKVIIAGLTGQQPNKPMLGHTFVGYRRKAFDEFVALMNLSGNEQRMDKYTCEQVVKNGKPGNESYEACKKALQHWPSA